MVDNSIYIPFSSREQMLDTIFSFSVYNRARTMPYQWVRHIESDNIYMITGYLTNGVMLNEFVSFEDLFENYEFIDGHTPCGVCVEFT